MIPLLVIFLTGYVTRNSILASAAAIIMIMTFMRLERFYPLLEKRGIELGLLFLTMALLVPLADERVVAQDFIRVLVSPVGLLAVAGGLVGAHFNAQGVALLGSQPELVPGILLGIILCVALFDGISVGPVMAAGITATLVRLLLR